MTDATVPYPVPATHREIAVNIAHTVAAQMPDGNYPGQEVLALGQLHATLALVGTVTKLGQTLVQATAAWAALAESLKPPDGQLGECPEHPGQHGDH